MNAALTATGLGKAYGSTWALRDCNLTVVDGSVVALVGHNGAGKTTLLHLAVGLVRPTAGRVELFGRAVNGQDPEALALVGFVGQERPLYPRMTTAEHLRMGGALNSRWDQAWAERRLREVGVDRRKRVSQLSGGQRAQVALALALAKRPRLLVLDEPVAGLDPLARRDVMRMLMDAVAGDGVTVVISSHVVSELERVCDHVVLLSGGRVELAGEIDSVVGAHRLLVGPRLVPAQVGAVPGLVSAIHGDRQSHLVVDTSVLGAVPHPRWEQHPISLEQVVLAYLERRPDPSSEHEPAVAR
ncbi:MAG: ABC transporter ATP-binding protein [Phycicoccus sp.]